MVKKVLKPISEVVGQYTGLSRRVLDWTLIQKGLMDASKKSEFDPKDWGRLSDFVDKERFKRIGTVKEEMRFEDFIEFMQRWAPFAHWEGSFKRITEYDNVVTLELEERVLKDGQSNAMNTISVYEFDSIGKLLHLDVYMQQELDSII